MALDQSRWDEYGKGMLAVLEERPHDFTVAENPNRNVVYGPFLERVLGDVNGTTILEVGTGTGAYANFLAKGGAKVIGIDVGPNLVAASRLRARLTGAGSEFVQASVTQLPFPDASFDVIVGLAILHHLGDDDLAAAFRETERVLRRPGIAVYAEPVKNSRLLEFTLQLVPAGTRGRAGYRPAVWQRRIRRDYETRSGERTLTNDILLRGGSAFDSAQLHPFGFLDRLERLLHRRSRTLRRVDSFLLAHVPPLRRLSRFVVAVYEKR